MLADIEARLARGTEIVKAGQLLKRDFPERRARELPLSYAKRRRLEVQAAILRYYDDRTPVPDELLEQVKRDVSQKKVSGKILNLIPYRFLKLV